MLLLLGCNPLGSLLLLLLLALANHEVSSFVSQPKLRRHLKITATTRHQQRHGQPKPTPSVPSLIQASSDDKDTSSSARVRFSGLSSAADGQTATVSSPVDFILQWITSDVGSIVLGVGGLVLLVIGRLVLDSSNAEVDAVESMGQATRSNLLAVFATGAVLLNGLSKLDVESALAETVDLVGTTLPSPILLSSINNNKDDGDDTLVWVLESLLAATPAQTAMLLQQQDDTAATGGWKICAMAGTIPATTASDSSSISVASSTPIMDRFRKAMEGSPSSDDVAETYLPTLQALPGKAEFTYLPVNTQAALLLPIASSTTTVLVLGSNQARSFAPRDIAWCRTVVTRLG